MLILTVSDESKSPPSGFVPPSPPTFASTPVNSATQHLSEALQQLSRPAAANGGLNLTGLSQLLLQNPLLAAQLQQQQHSQQVNVAPSSSQPADVSAAARIYGAATPTTSVAEVVATEASLLSSLALRERQLAAAIRL